MSGGPFDDETATLLSKMHPVVAGALQQMWEQEASRAHEKAAEEEQAREAIQESGASEKEQEDATVDDAESDVHVALVDVESRTAKRRKVNTCLLYTSPSPRD